MMSILPMMARAHRGEGTTQGYSQLGKMLSLVFSLNSTTAPGVKTNKGSVSWGEGRASCPHHATMSALRTKALKQIISACLLCA